MFLSLGANVGDRLFYIESAHLYIEKFAVILERSYIYETTPWHDTPTTDTLYLNQVLHIKTELSPESLLVQLLQVEKDLGRVRTARWADRTIDLDILLCGQDVIHTSSLTIPHPYLHVRKFVLLPLIEMGYGSMIHPVYQQSIDFLYQKCADKSEVILYQPKCVSR